MNYMSINDIIRGKLIPSIIINDFKKGLIGHEERVAVGHYMLSQCVNPDYFESTLELRELSRQWLKSGDDSLIYKYYMPDFAKTEDEKNKVIKRIERWLMAKRGTLVHQWIRDKLEKKLGLEFEVSKIKQMHSDKVGSDYVIHAKIDAVDRKNRVVYEFKSRPVSTIFKEGQPLEPPHDAILQGNGYAKIIGAKMFVVVLISAEGYDMVQWEYEVSDELWNQLIKNVEFLFETEVRRLKVI